MERLLLPLHGWVRQSLGNLGKELGSILKRSPSPDPSRIEKLAKLSAAKQAKLSVAKVAKVSEAKLAKLSGVRLRPELSWHSLGSLLSLGKFYYLVVLLRFGSTLIGISCCSHIYGITRERRALESAP